MTGYGRGEATGVRFRCTVEARSVNSRYLEIRPRLPRSLNFLESALREKVQKKVKRGALDLSVSVQLLADSLSGRIDATLARAYASKVHELSREMGLDSGLTLASLLRLPGVITSEEALPLESEKEIPQLVQEALAAALGELLEMRKKEGEKLGRVLERELADIRSHQEWIYKHREELNQRHFKKLQARVKDWRGQAELEETRLYQEVAYYLDRSDVTEELDRLASHLTQCEDALRAGDSKSVGKRLEFLAQELGREINTIGSKSDQTQITNHVVDMKLTLEKIREQVQNLE